MIHVRAIVRLGPVVVVACLSDAPPLDETGEGSESTAAPTTTQGSTTSPDDVGDPTTASIESTTSVDASGDVTSEPGTSSGTGVSAMCGDGVVDEGEQCDDANTEPGDGCHSDCTEYKLVFVTSGPTAGALDGLAGADEQCQTAATEAAHSGTFRAWLSDDSISATERLGGSELAYRLVDGTRVAEDWNHVLGVGLEVAIHLDEHGGSVPSGDAVWTGTSPMGEILGPTCAGWTPMGMVGRVGYVDWTDVAQWTDADEHSCALLNHLYCFEQ